MHVFNDLKYKDLRQKLRSHLPRPEFVFWQAIRGKKLGVKFRRQHGIGNYIVDFYAAEISLIVELDGESHFTERGVNSDESRTITLCDLGMKVVRYTNLQIMRELPSVLEDLKRVIEHRKSALNS
ncbi:endonuclease domain-containing protein [Rahnella inusitata]|uniref:endonuclease domain-containing protein n=1 Tax=Rahnella inusitata TaxID=58169 RepID=UPI0039BDD75A